LALASGVMKSCHRSASLSSSQMQKKALKALGTRPIEQPPNRDIVKEETNEEEREGNERLTFGLHSSPPNIAADKPPFADEWNQQVEVRTATAVAPKEEPIVPQIRTASPSLTTGHSSSSLGQLHEFAPRIVVAGVGGGGSNAVNHMIAKGLQGMLSAILWAYTYCVLNR
jgi:hypothetical protein